MEGLFTLLAIAVGGYLLIGPLLGIVAFSRLQSIRSEVWRLRQKLAALTLQLTAVQKSLEALQAGQGPASRPAAAPPPRPGTDKPTSDPKPAPKPPSEPVSEQAPQPAAPSPPGPSPTAAPAAAAAATPPPVRTGEPAAAGGLAGLEESLASRWLVWLGALALSLGGAFLVKVSIERGWLGPELRVTLGFLAGLACVGAGEWLRRRPLQQAIARVSPDYVPPALTGAGLFIAFASLYAAYALYGFLSPVVAFVLLAAVAFAAFALSLLQGPALALLGLLGGLAVPLLVSTGTPQPWPLFTFLLVLSAAALALVRYKDWWWLAWTTLAGSYGWALLWLAEAWVPDSTLPLGLYLVLLTALFFFLRPLVFGADLRGETALEIFLPVTPRTRLLLSASAAATALLWILVQQDDYGQVSLGFATFAIAAFVFAAWRLPALQILSYFGAVLALAVLGNWPLALPPADPELAEASGLLAMALVFGLILGGGGFGALWGSRRPDVWAAFSAATTLAIFTLVYLREGRADADLPWAAAALVLAAVFLGAASLVGRYREQRGYDGALGVYAAAGFAAIGLGSAIGLEKAWLTVGLSLQLPALAWVALKLRVTLLRQAAWVVAAVVMVRLLLNPEILSYPLGSLPGLTWILYGYGVPCIAFFLAAWWFRKQEDGRLVMLLKAGSIAFGVLLVSFQIRNLMAGTLDNPDYTLLEQSLQSIAWLGMAYGLLQLSQRYGRQVAEWAWRVLGSVAALQVLLLQVLVNNPLWSGEGVGEVPVFNVLLLAYAVPAVFAVLFIPALRRIADEKLSAASGIFALFLTLLFLSLEVRRTFQGPDLSGPWLGDAELYAYSLVWLIYAGGLLAAAFFWHARVLRYASLVIVMLTVGKVFLIDMAELTGLLRAVSFAGLGLSLIGIGFLYQRFVLFPKVPEETT